MNRLSLVIGLATILGVGCAIANRFAASQEQAEVERLSGLISHASGYFLSLDSVMTSERDAISEGEAIKTLMDVAREPDLRLIRRAVIHASESGRPDRGRTRAFLIPLVFELPENGGGGRATWLPFQLKNGELHMSRKYGRMGKIPTLDMYLAEFDRLSLTHKRRSPSTFPEPAS